MSQLSARDEELSQGIAIAVSMRQPQIHSGQSFAMRLGYGNFDGESAVGFTAAGVVARGAFGPASSITLDIGLGASGSVIGGGAGVTLGW